jgi:histidine triad (HIT) family protein
MLKKIFLVAVVSISFCSAGECAFCDSKVLVAQTFYEDDVVLGLYTHKPILPGHCLIIPKRHVKRYEDLTEDEAVHIHRVIKKIDKAVMGVFDTSSYLLLQKNGREAGQTVPHVHFHYVPRKTGDDSSVKFVLQMFWANMQSPISRGDMGQVVLAMKEALQTSDSQ